MRLIKPYSLILDKIDGVLILRRIEGYGRICYKSEELITKDSYKKFINKLVHELHHESVIEHEKITVKIVCDRGISHEIVRHRIASYSQESTRYCNYTKDKFDNNITFIIPCWLQLEEGIFDHHKIYEYSNPMSPENSWLMLMQTIEYNYSNLIEMGWTPQQARSILPNALKTEIVVTYNLREWRHFFKLRTSKQAHPQMREISIPLLKEFQKQIPIIFDDIVPEE